MKTDTVECTLPWIRMIEELQVKRIQEEAIPLGILFSYIAFSPCTKTLSVMYNTLFFCLGYAAAVSRCINKQLQLIFLNFIMYIRMGELFITWSTPCFFAALYAMVCPHE